MTCNLSDSYKNGIINTALQMAEDTTMFNIEEQTLVPKDPSSNFQGALNDISLQFGENIFIEEDGKFTVNPSQELIDSYVEYSNSQEDIQEFDLHNREMEIEASQAQILQALSTKTKKGEGTTNILSKVDGQFYIVSTRGQMPREAAIDLNIQRFERFLAFNNIPQDMYNMTETKTPSGERLVKISPNKKYNQEETKQDRVIKSHKTDKVNAIISFLKEKFNLTDEVVFISREDYLKKYPKDVNVNSAVKDGKIYIIEQTVDNQIATEELLHPLVYTLQKNNPALFSKLLEEAKRTFPQLYDNIAITYGDQSVVQKNNELVTQALSRIFSDQFEDNIKPSFHEVAKEVLKWFQDVLNNLMNYFSANTPLDLSLLGDNLSLQDLADLINTSDSQFRIEFPENVNFLNKTEVKSLYNTVYDFLVDKNMEDKVNELLNNINKNARTIINKIEKNPNERNRIEILNFMSKINQSTTTKQELINKISMIMQVSKTLIDLGTQLNSTQKITDPSQKLVALNGIYNSVAAFDEFNDMISELSYILENELGRPAELKEFYRQLDGAIAIPQKVKREIERVGKESVKKTIIEYNKPLIQAQLDNYNKQIKDLENKKTQTTSLREKSIYDTRIKKLLKERDLLPSEETVEKIFAGDYYDSNSISGYLESAIVNGHPVISTFASILKDLQIQNQQDMLAAQNQQQTLIDDFKKDAGIKELRNLEEIYKPIISTTKIPTKVKEDANGAPLLDEKGQVQFEYVEQKTLLSDEDPNYITGFEELRKLKEYYGYKVSDAKAKGNPDLVLEYQTKLEQTSKQLSQYVKDNSERFYTDEIYQMWALLDQEIPTDNGFTTIRKEKGDITEEMQRIQQTLDTTSDPDLRNQLLLELDSYVRELKQLRSPWDEHGTPKTGTDLAIANLMTEFSNLQKQYGDFVLDERSMTQFEVDSLNLDTRYRTGEITEAEWKRQKSLMTTTEIKPEFWEEYDRLTEVVAQYSEILATQIPELANTLNPESRRLIKEGQKKIRETTNPYRDLDSKINGVELENTSPILRDEIKKSQEAFEELKNNTAKLTGLSMSERMELRKLIAQPTRSPQETTRMLDLQKKKDDLKKIYRDNKKDIDAYMAALNELSTLFETETSHYYTTQRDNQFNLHLQSQVVTDLTQERLATGNFLIGGITYSLQEGVWTKIDSGISDRVNPTEDGSTEVESIVRKAIAQETFNSTKWFKDNHFKKYQWNKEQRRFEEVQAPIYIWMESTPKNKEFIKDGVPAFRYRKYVVKEQYHNKNYGYTYKQIPKAKSNLHRDSKYQSLKNATDAKSKALYKFLEAQRKIYNSTQDILPQEKRLGNVLPSIVKTQGENQVELTNNIKKAFSTAASTNFGATEEDTSYLLGGSIKNKKDKEIPIRFTGNMDASRQSSNIPFMMLTFQYSSLNWKRLSDQEPFFKSLKRTVQDLPVLQAKQLGTKITFKGSLKKFLDGGAPKIYEEKGGPSNLSTSLENFMNMFVYGEMSKESVIEVFGAGVDLNKVSSKVMAWASNVTFIGNVYSAVKNTVSTKVQQAINSSIDQGFYTHTDVAKGQAQSLKHIRDFMMDFSKVGNKSEIGQALEYFQALQGSLVDEFSRKTQFTVLKEKGTLLAGPKNFSEFEAQVAQFLTMANAQKVELNGKMVPLLEAYHLKDGVFQQKPGAVFSKEQEVTFIKRMQNVNRKIAGAYREDERGQIETNWLGKLAMFMNRYFVPMFANRYAGYRNEIETGSVSVGYWREGLGILKDVLFKYQADYNTYWSTLTPREKASFKKSVEELSFVIGLTILCSLMGGDDDKKELKKNTAVYNFMLGVMIGVNNETQAFLDYKDLVRKAQMPFMALNQIKQLAKVVDLTYKTVTDADEAYYKRGTGIKDGFHDKGDSKLISNFLKLIGYTGVTFNPEEIVKRQSSLSQLR